MTRNVHRAKTKRMVTYSKKFPIQFVNTAHFLTPETPDDSTAGGSLEGKRSSQVLSVPQKQLPQKQHQKLEGGSYSSLIQPKQSLLEGNGHALSASRSMNIRGGPSLALRDISNIPIEKTLSTTPCRGSHNNQAISGRRQSETSKMQTPHSGQKQRKQRLAQMGRSKHQSSRRRVKNILPVAALMCKSNNATCHSARAMLTCTLVDLCSDTANKTCSTAHSVQSMSLCSSAGATSEAQARLFDCSAEMVTQQPANSTFNEGSCQEFRDTVPQDLSTIGEPCQTDDKEQEKTSGPPAAAPTRLSNTSHHKNVKNMTPHKKPSQDMTCDEAGEQHCKLRTGYGFLTSTVISKDVPCEPTSSTPTDPGKVPPLMLDISEIECEQRKVSVTEQDVNTENLLDFDPLPLEVSSTVDTHTMANHVKDSRKDITPESEQQKYSPTATPQHKRRLAYLHVPMSSEPEEFASCCLLADWPHKKGTICSSKYKQLAPWNKREQESLPTDVLCIL